MNIIAVDIGNTNIKIALFLDNTEDSIESVPGSSPSAKKKLEDILQHAWEKIPFAEAAKERKRRDRGVGNSLRLSSFTEEPGASGKLAFGNS